jgi:fatty-acyl-CoA synthase
MHRTMPVPSYARGLELALLEKTVGEILRETAARVPGRDAVISPHQKLRLTWRDLEQKVASVAGGLVAMGIRPGDRVGMYASSCAEWVYLQVATAAVGAVLVNVNPAYRSHELGYVLERSRMKAIFLHERDARVCYLQILEQARALRDTTSLEHVIVLDTGSWDAMLRNAVPVPEYRGSPHDVINIQYTSGTTGSPKGVLLTHHNLVNNAWVAGQRMRFGDSDRLCLPLPLYHCFGCVLGSLACIVFGVPMVLPAGQFDPGATLEAIERERCTIIYGVPTMFIAELEHPDLPRRDLTSLRAGCMGGAPCPIEVMRRVANEMHCPQMAAGYGQTESSPAITISEPDDDLETRSQTIGSALANTEVKIVAPWNGVTQPAGELGELCTRGYLVMKGYDGDPAATAHAIDGEGWLHTGDLAVMREDGRFQIKGRLKEMIIRGGENIYPREVEDFLHQHPKIADVYVLGLPDERLGETVLAWIRLKAGETMMDEEVRQFCAGKIAHFKIPQYVRFVDAFPMTVTGKVQKFVIREQEIEARGLRAAASIKTA